MDQTTISKHFVAIDGLQASRDRSLNLVRHLRKTQSKALDQHTNKLLDNLIGSLTLLFVCSSGLGECLCAEAERGRASICVILGLNECADLCGENHRLLTTLEEIENAESNSTEHLSALNPLAADQGHLRDLTNSVYHIASRIDVLNQLFTLARKVQTYRYDYHMVS